EGLGLPGARGATPRSRRELALLADGHREGSARLTPPRSLSVCPKARVKQRVASRTAPQSRIEGSTPTSPFVEVVRERASTCERATPVGCPLLRTLRLVLVVRDWNVREATASAQRRGRSGIRPFLAPLNDRLQVSNAQSLPRLQGLATVWRRHRRGGDVVARSWKGGAAPSAGESPI